MTAQEPIPFNAPNAVGNEFEYVHQAVTGGHTSSSGPFSQRARSILREELAAKEVLLTTSCTGALEMTALLLEPKPGDTVIVPSFTFVTTALAFARAGFGLVFADIEPETHGLDPSHVAQLIDDTTRAVVTVHYAGVACDLDGLRRVLADHPEVELIEDNAHGLLGSFDGTPLGSFGRFSTLSFHETKNFFCGEGGALVVNRSEDIGRARVILDKGTDRQQFLLGEIDKYSWRDTGSSFGLADLNAAFLLAQLEQRAEIQQRRQTIYETYLHLLAPEAERLGIRLPVIRPNSTSAYHLFHVLAPTASVRTGAMRRMRAEHVFPTFHYVPLHSSEGGRRFASRVTECPVTDDVSHRLIRLPFFNTLTDSQIERVATTLIETLQAELDG